MYRKMLEYFIFDIYFLTRSTISSALHLWQAFTFVDALVCVFIYITF